VRKFEGSSYGSPGSFALVEAPVPDPSSGEIRIRIEATALGFVDGLIVQGLYQIKPPLPYVPGGEIAGVVDAIGPGVTAGLSVGDRVVTWQLGGGLADCVVVPAGDVDRVPDGLDLASAAAMLVDYQTAHYALFERAKVRPGETVLVLGAAGGVGSAAVQMAARAGAYVIAAASSEQKREQARLSGASATIDYGGEDVRSEIRAKAPEGAVDVVFDPVGGAITEPMFRSLAKGGRHLVIGFTAGHIPALPTNLALLKDAALLGVEIRHFVTTRPDDARRARMSLFVQVASGALAKPRMIAFPLENGGEALATTLRRDKSGKVVVFPQAPSPAAQPSERLEHVFLDAAPAVSQRPRKR
jgi:NADPH:quinone reductase